MNNRPKPGKGWSHLGGAVWEHVSGVRLHLLGLIKLQNGEEAWANRWPESQEADRCIRIAGGSRKRGLMIWALCKFGESTISGSTAEG